MTDNKSTESDSTLPTTEEWRDIPGYEGLYQASDLGHVRRVKKTGTKPLRPYRAAVRYLQVQLYRDGDSKRYLVHRLITLAFYGECPPNHEVNHINGASNDNRLQNLEYVTHKQNIRHSFDALGRLAQKGETQVNAKLKDSEVREIKRLLKSGVQIVRIAAQFRVSTTTISKIKLGKKWKHIKD